MITVLALILAAHAVIDEIRLYRLCEQIRQQEQRIDGLLDYLDNHEPWNNK